MIRNGFKFLWNGAYKGQNGVGVIVANWLIGAVKVSVDDQKKIRKEHMGKLMNVVIALMLVR